MALVTKIEYLALEKNSIHSEVDCTYDIITTTSGEKFLQLDTYGSKARMNPGKKSQSIRLSPNALAELKEIIKNYNL